MNPVLRASPRYPVSLRVAFDGDGARVNEATSLSVGGMFVRTDHELPVGETVQLRSVHALAGIDIATEFLIARCARRKSRVKTRHMVNRATARDLVAVAPTASVTESYP